MSNPSIPHRWPNEAALVATLEGLLSCQSEPSRDQSVILIREFDTGMGKPDLLVISLCRATLEARARSLGSSDVPSLTRAAGYALSVLEAEGPLSDLALGSRLRVTKRRCHDTIDVLMGRRLASFESGMVYPIDPVETFAIQHIDAYEAKLADWKAVADQAVRHHWFASRSFVVMPPRPLSVTEPLIELCDAMRVGVAYLSPTDKLEVLRDQPRRIPSRTPLTWILNEKAVDDLKA